MFKVMVTCNHGEVFIHQSEWDPQLQASQALASEIIKALSQATLNSKSVSCPPGDQKNGQSGGRDFFFIITIIIINFSWLSYIGCKL